MQRFRAGSLVFLAPKSWDEVTLSQFLTLTNPDAPDSAGFVISTLTGRPEEEFKREDAPVDVTSFVLEHLKFTRKLPTIEDLLPSVLHIEGKEIELPKDLGSVAKIGQMWDIDLLIRTRQREGDPVDPASMAEYLLPVFLWPLLRSEPYTDRYKAAELWPIISGMPCLEGLAASGFFLLNSLNPTPTGKVSVEEVTKTPLKGWRHRLPQSWQRLIPSMLVSN